MFPSFGRWIDGPRGQLSRASDPRTTAVGHAGILSRALRSRRLRFESLERRELLSISQPLSSQVLDESPALYGDLSPSARLLLSSTLAALTDQTSVFQFHFDGLPQVTQQGLGVVVSLSGEESLTSPGMPLLPMRSSTVLLPPGLEISSVSVSYGDAGTLLAQNVLLAASPPEDASDPAATTVYSGSDFPAQGPVEFTNSVQNGYSLGMLEVFPVEYQASSGSLTYHQDLMVTLHLEQRPAGSALQVRNNADDRARVAALVDNPQALASYDAVASAQASQQIASPLAGTPDYQYVIITSSSLASSFQPLLNEKLSRGLTGAIFTTDYIYANYSGSETHDNPDKIRDFIRDMYLNHNTEWVLLGGDSEVVPVRGVYATAGSLSETALATDMYYGCLDGTWNGNGNSLWGESTDGVGGGDIDLTADVYVGRAPASNATEAANFVAKTLLYETTPPPNPTEGLFLGGIIDSTTYGSYSGMNIRDTVLPANWQASLLELYDTSSSTWTASQLISYLNSSPAIVESLGHSGTTIDSKLTPADVQALTNAFPYLMYSQGCDAGGFDLTDLSVAEAQVVSQYGAFAMVANTREGWYVSGTSPGYSHYYAKDFWNAIFNLGYLHLGEAEEYSKQHNLIRVGTVGTYRWLNFTITLFGDPEVSFQLTPASGNTPPVATGDSYSTSEDTPLTVAAPGVLANDTDADGDLLTAALVSGPAHGSLTFGSDGSFTYTPNSNYSGPDSFSYQANDNSANSNSAIVNINVTAVNDPPSGTNKTIATFGRHGLHILRGGLRLQRFQ